MAAGTNEGMPKLLSLAAVLLVSAALTTTPALAAEPVTATADFQEALFSPVDGVLDFEETADGIKVTGKVDFSLHHPFIKHFKSVQRLTRRTPKMTIPAPSAIYGRPMATPINKDVYPDLDAFFHDVGRLDVRLHPHHNDAHRRQQARRPLRRVTGTRRPGNLSEGV